MQQHTAHDGAPSHDDWDAAAPPDGSTAPDHAAPSGLAEQANEIAYFDEREQKVWVSTRMPECVEFFREHGGSRSVNKRAREILEASLARLGRYQRAVFEGLGIKVAAEILHDTEDADDEETANSPTEPEEADATRRAQARPSVSASASRSAPELPSAHLSRSAAPELPSAHLSRSATESPSGVAADPPPTPPAGDAAVAVSGVDAASFRCGQCGVVCSNRSGLTRHCIRKHGAAAEQ